MKNFEFCLKYVGKMVGPGTKIFDKLEPEPEFSTSRCRSRTKMDRLHNTGLDPLIMHFNSTGTAWQIKDLNVEVAPMISLLENFFSSC
jgi:hypothetical protein